MRTELRQIVGKRPRKNGPEIIHFPIDQILFDGRHIGQVGHAEGANVVLFSSADPANHELIRKEVQEIRGIKVADKVAKAQAIPAEIKGDDDDDE